MENLLIILFVLGVALFLLVTLGEKVLKPMEPESQAKLSRWMMILVGVMLVLGVVKFYFM
ncbi:MAG: hypothetical protein CR978_01430 [Gammaproteobacteria bacterium]|nr:MAG: hypothetical protein CR978_01430 [Gammaproteobacteria bacterium]PIE37729.1 MAG: hypothetical protein CSA53_05185 [Gammaproteobacteria bacterium]